MKWTWIYVVDMCDDDQEVLDRLTNGEQGSMTNKSSAIDGVDV